MAYGQRMGRQMKGQNSGGWRRQGLWTRKHRSTQQEQVPQNPKGVGTQDIAAMFDTITKSLSFLAERVKILEGGPDQKTGRPAQGPSKEAGPPIQIKSNNDDFAAVVKDMYRMVQLDHHAENWTQLPKSLSERLHKFAADIKPPMVDEELSAVITDATQAYSARICDAVRQHIATKRAETESVAATRNASDLDRAKEITERQLTRRLGRRLDESKRQQLLDQAAKTIGARRRQPVVDSDGFQLVVNKKNTTISPGNPSGTPSKKRKLATSSPPPVSTSNFFRPLQDMSDVEPQNQDEEGDESDVNDDSDIVVSSYLAKAKSCAQVEEAAFAAAAAAEKQVIAQVEVHRPATPAAVQARKDTDADAAAASFPPIQPQKQEAPGTVRALQQSTAVAEARRPAAPPHHTRAMSLDRASQLMRPSARTMPTKDGVVVYKSTDKAQWQIYPADGTKALLIGGSNLRSFSSVPPGWEVHCLPGAKLWHVNSALEHLLLQVPKGLTAIYVYAGINHRDAHPDTYARDIDWLLSLRSQTSIRIAFVGVPTPATLTTEQRQNVKALNARMAEALGNEFIPPIPDAQVEILKNDQYRIHHTAYTSNRIMAGIRKHAHTIYNLN